MEYPSLWNVCPFAASRSSSCILEALSLQWDCSEDLKFCSMMHFAHLVLVVIVCYDTSHVTALTPWLNMLWGFLFCVMPVHVISISLLWAALEPFMWVSRLFSAQRPTFLAFLFVCFFPPQFLQVYVGGLYHVQPQSFSPPFVIYYSPDVLLFTAGWTELLTVIYSS